MTVKPQDKRQKRVTIDEPSQMFIVQMTSEVILKMI